MVYVDATGYKPLWHHLLYQSLFVPDIHLPGLYPSAPDKTPVKYPGTNSHSLGGFEKERPGGNFRTQLAGEIYG